MAYRTCKTQQSCSVLFCRPAERCGCLNYQAVAGSRLVTAADDSGASALIEIGWPGRRCLMLQGELCSRYERAL